MSGAYMNGTVSNHQGAVDTADQRLVLSRCEVFKSSRLLTFGGQNLKSGNVFRSTRRKSFRVFYYEIALCHRHQCVTLHLQAIIHPDSGQKVPMPFRMSGTGSLAVREGVGEGFAGRWGLGSWGVG